MQESTSLLQPRPPPPIYWFIDSGCFGPGCLLGLTATLASPHPARRAQGAAWPGPALGLGSRIRLPGGRGRLAPKSRAPEPPARREQRRGGRAAAPATYPAVRGGGRGLLPGGVWPFLEKSSQHPLTKMRQLKGKPKKETSKDKKERKQAMQEARQQITTVVLPTLAVVVLLIVVFVYVATRPTVTE
ncbi:single-pass membrane and coiled-coil domain-containing protein 4 isoform X1 [Arvicanthis niloticus]|uniref:single-pass membrane and coiled-coil domain-containing protein 4 isoform X1 n=1 Tax=Arvicanthis niloticus TaxID=61156 RepID=UPI00402B2993